MLDVSAVPIRRQQLTPIEKYLVSCPLFDFDSEQDIVDLRRVLNSAFAFLEEPEQDFVALASSFLPLTEYSVFEEKGLEQDLSKISEIYEKHKKTNFVHLRPVPEKIARLESDRDEKHRLEVKDNQTAMPDYVSTATTYGTNSLVILPSTSSTLVNVIDPDLYRNIYISPPDWGVNNHISGGTIVHTGTTYFNVVTSGQLDTANIVYGNSDCINSFTKSRIHSPSESIASYAKRQLDSKTTKNARRVITRQLGLLESVLPSKDIHCFLNGEVITIFSERTRIKYHFQLTNAVSVKRLTKGNHYSSPYSLKIHDEDDHYLASLCVYIKDTPILDQLSAMIMYIRSGEDKLLLKAANQYKYGDTGRLRILNERLGFAKKNDRVPHVMVRNDSIASTTTFSSNVEKEQLTDLQKRYRVIAHDYHLLKMLSSYKKNPYDDMPGVYGQNVIHTNQWVSTGTNTAPVLINLNYQ